jgi:hypothetical protein
MPRISFTQIYAQCPLNFIYKVMKDIDKKKKIKYNEDTQEQAPGYLRWRGKLLYWPGPYPDPKIGVHFFSGGKFSGASSGVWIRPSNQEEMDNLRHSREFVLTTHSIVDLTIMFCIERKIYNIYDINALLIEMKQNVLVKE